MRTGPEDVVTVTLRLRRSDAVWLRRSILASARSFEHQAARHPDRLRMAARFHRLAEAVKDAYHDAE